MSGSLHIGLAVALGAAVGIAYCLLLWRNLSSLLVTRRPGTRVLFGAAIRVLLTVVALYVIGGGQWQHLGAALVGFALARGVVSKRLVHGPPQGPRP